MFDDLRPHLVELRKRLGLSVLSVFIAFIIAFTFHNQILSWITQPLNNALVEVGRIIESQEKATWTMKSDEVNVTKTPAVQAADKLKDNLYEAAKVADPKLAPLLKNAADAAESLDKIITKRDVESARPNQHNFEGKITTHQVGGAFFVALKVSFFAGLLGAMPFILYQLWLFVAPGLYSNEKKMVIPFVVGGSVMFFIGVMFAYYIVTPFGFQFLITFGSFLYTPFINIEDYVGFFTKIMLGFGVAFELPVFAYFLALLGLVTDRTLIDFFKYAIVIIFVLAALLTPPDILTQLLMAAPLVILYGISILIVRMVNPEKSEDDGEDEEETESKETASEKLLPDELDKP
ncbi:twin-arginine translocase subunit TatC [Sulfurovum sp. NBC37-1]|uniref:twin-arginine translocase subunit TatC n=1 Tax=Sulfurovum sp. (strain NBC37-1) TaxID=387093 RepID=UPI00015878ED|nr:twin-arginine translocase subunit TatC [Sulfurovum sp. NBC37-1]BAF71412.1 twin-arginine translocation system component TatC [Sulfurovum sp. NBC37-1]